LFVFLIFSLFILLKIGIEIDTLKVSKYDVSGLYIKLGKKLTLKAEQVTVHTTEEVSSSTHINEEFEQVKYILTFFEYIELKKIISQNNTMSIRFKHDLLKINTKEFDISGTVHREGNRIETTIPSLYIKEHNITVSGKLSYSLNDHSIEADGHYIVSDLTGNFSIEMLDNVISFNLSSNTFNDLEKIIDKFDLSAGVRSWVVDRVQAETYTLQKLHGKIVIDNGNFEFDMDALEGEILFSNVQIAFHEDLSSVVSEDMVLSYKNYGLFFDLKKPMYRGKDLNGSTVSILNLNTDDTKLILDLRMLTPYDKTLRKLLKAYDITIPLKQENGTLNTRFQADIGLKQSHNSFLVDVNLSKGNLWINKVKLVIEKGKLHYADGYIYLKNVYIKDTLYQGYINGEIDLEKKQVNLDFDAKYIKLGEKKKEFFILRDEKLPLVINYQNELNIEVPKLALRLDTNQTHTTLKIKDINKIKSYIVDTTVLENGGNLIIKTKDFQTYMFDGEMKRTTCFIYENKDVCKVRVPFEGKVTAHDLYFYAFDKRIYYNQKISQIKIKNINIDLEKFLQSANVNSKKDTKNKETKALSILGKNSNLRYGKYTLVTDTYDVKVNENGDIKAVGSTFGDMIKFSKNKNVSNIQALRIKDKALHPLINFKGLQEGRYTFKTLGIVGKDMKGDILIEGGVMKGFQAYNNTLAFINTLPALAVLHNPGYSEEGFHIEKASASYRMINQEKIIFDTIHIKGGSANIIGKGEVDLEKKTIQMNLAIQVARELGEVVGNIPLVGYILLGEDKSITVGLTISGSLDKPVVQTTTAEDIASLPLKLIQRTLESPIKLLTPSDTSPAKP